MHAYLSSIMNRYNYDELVARDVFLRDIASVSIAFLSDYLQTSSKHFFDLPVSSYPITIISIL